MYKSILFHKKIHLQYLPINMSITLKENFFTEPVLKMESLNTNATINYILSLCFKRCYRYCQKDLLPVIEIHCPK